MQMTIEEQIKEIVSLVKGLGKVQETQLEIIKVALTEVKSEFLALERKVDIAFIKIRNLEGSSSDEAREKANRQARRHFLYDTDETEVEGEPPIRKSGSRKRKRSSLSTVASDNEELQAGSRNTWQDLIEIAK